MGSGWGCVKDGFQLGMRPGTGVGDLGLGSGLGLGKCKVTPSPEAAKMEEPRAPRI